MVKQKVTSIPIYDMIILKLKYLVVSTQPKIGAI